MTMKEVYRSFEGKLNADNQNGTIIYDGGDYWQIESLSVWEDAQKTLYRIAKNALSPSEFEDTDKIAKIEIDISNGNYEDKNMQEFYKGKWYSSPTIRKIQNSNEDYNWKRYI